MIAPNKAEQVRLVAFLRKELGLVLFCQGETIETMVEEVSPWLNDICNIEWDFDNDIGIRIWEGESEWVTSGAPWDLQEDEEMFYGDWRNPTDEEWECIKQNKSPWPSQLKDKE